MSELDNLFGGSDPVATSSVFSTELESTVEVVEVVEPVEEVVDNTTYLQTLHADVETARNGRRIEDIPAQDDEPFHVATRRLQAFHQQTKDK